MNIVAVIIVFFPDHIMLQRLIDSLTNQVDKILLVDNGTDEASISQLIEYSNDLATLIRLKRNVGIAAAQNVGFKWAYDVHASYVILFDQDSEPGHDMVCRLISVAEEKMSLGVSVAAVGPRYYDQRQNNPPPFLQTRKMRLRRQVCHSDDEVVEVDYLVSSGSLIPLEAYREIGAMEERLFIDYVDIEWGLRARSKGFHSYGVCGAKMSHALGNAPIELFGRRFPCRSPLRHYYMFRNAIWMYQQGWIPLQWKVADGWRLGVKYVFYSSLASPRWQHLKMMSAGVWHGLIGRMGSYNPLA
jgi:rhamnosyltransferase